MAEARDTTPIPRGALRARAESRGPRTPRDLLRSGSRGWVLASFVLDTTGAPDPRSAAILATSDARYARAVCDAVPGLRYAPLLQDGRVVALRIGQRFEFRAGS